MGHLQGVPSYLNRSNADPPPNIRQQITDAVKTVLETLGRDSTPERVQHEVDTFFKELSQPSYNYPKHTYLGQTNLPSGASHNQFSDENPGRTLDCCI